MALNFAVLNRAIVEKRVQLNGLIGRCTVFILAREWYEHVLIGVVVFQAGYVLVSLNDKSEQIPPVQCEIRKAENNLCKISRLI